MIEFQLIFNGLSQTYSQWERGSDKAFPEILLSSRPSLRVFHPSEHHLAFSNLADHRSVLSSSLYLPLSLCLHLTNFDVFDGLDPWLPECGDRNISPYIPATRRGCG